MKKYFLIAISVIAFGFTACLKTNPLVDSKNADISFNVKSATKTTFASVSFEKTATIGEQGDTIWLVTNKDSLPYLTKPDSLVPVISGSNLHSVVITTKDTTITYNAQKPDTLDFSQPVEIIATAQDKKTTRKFKVVVNIHQQDPDLYTWTPRKNNIYSENADAEKLLVIDNSQFLYIKVGGVVKLYVCEDEQQWQSKTLTDFPNNFDIKYIYQTNDSLFIAQNNKIHSSKDGIVWVEKTANGNIDNLLFELNNQIFGITKSDLKLYKLVENSWEFVCFLPDNFPVEDMAICVTTSVSGAPRVFFVGGTDKDNNLTSAVFATHNGTHFSNLGATGTWFTPRKNVAVIQYHNTVLMIGGQNSSLIIDDYIYASYNYGASWHEPSPNMISDENIFVPRINMQSALNKEKTKMYFVGGQNGDGTWAKDAWVVMKNSVLWESMKNQ